MLVKITCKWWQINNRGTDGNMPSEDHNAGLID